GKFFTIKGQLIQLYPNKLESTEYFNKEVVYQAIVKPDHLQTSCWFYLLEKPNTEFETKTLESGAQYIDVPCEISGLLMKMEEFDTQDRKKPKNTAAIFIGNSLKVLEKPVKQVATIEWIYLLIGASFIIALILLLAAFVSRKYKTIPLAYKLRKIRQERNEQKPA
ncbi:MAG: hypothetical protein HY606_08595, partial [Planctomycetes bacterium]|nr:hypothetical protein [Planctomycetota bacterium]